MSVQEAAEVPCPLVFVSFPSAKDPSWEQKISGKNKCKVLYCIVKYLYTGLDKQNFQRKIVKFIFLLINFSICCGCSKEPSH